MANSRDFTGKNRKFTGTKGIVTPKGTTGERVGSESGEFRFNTTTQLMEYYDGNGWKPIDTPPTVTSITTNDAVGTSTLLNADGSSLFTITVNGTNFSIGASVKFIASTGAEFTAGNINRVSSTQITCSTTTAMASIAGAVDVRVVNSSGLSNSLEDAFTFNAPPVFVNASGSLGNVYSGLTISGSTLNASATDAESNTITYSIVSGSLPGSGLTLSSSTGMITGTLGGTPASGNYPFVVRAATTEGTVERQFSLQVVVPKGDQEYTSPGTYTFTVPAGVTSVSVVCIGAGGASGVENSGQAGGGGALAYRNGITVTPGTTATVIVGGANGRSGSNGLSGTASSFAYDGTTTTAGGGGGGSTTIAGGGGAPSGTYTGGGSGGAGGQDGQNAGGPGGGGAGGYTGNGGAGAGGYGPGTAQAGSNGSGGGGGGGGKGDSNEGGGGGGGGVSFYGEGSSGTGGIGQTMPSTVIQGGGGTGGSGGSAGSGLAITGAGGSGGDYGGGQGGTQSSITGGVAAGGAVRIVWDPSGTPPAFPSTNVNDV